MRDGARLPRGRTTPASIPSPPRVTCPACPFAPPGWVLPGLGANLLAAWQETDTSEGSPCNWAGAPSLEIFTSLLFLMLAGGEG